jgi:hypothetical protein
MVISDDIARLTLFLTSDGSRRIARQCFRVDGDL